MTAPELRKMSDEEIREYLLTDPNFIYQRYGRGESVLHRVVMEGRVELVKWLVGEYPDLLDMGDKDGNTAMHLLGETLYLERGKRGELALELSQVLLSAGAPVNRRNRRRETPLVSLFYRANAHDGFLKTMKNLLEAGSDPNVQDSAGNTYLHLLAEESDIWDCLPIVTVLLEAGADPKIQNVEGKTPAELALFTKNSCHTEYAGEFIALVEGYEGPQS